MFSQFKNVARALRGTPAADREMAYLNEAGDRYDLEARERNLSRGVLTRNFGF